MRIGATIGIGNVGVAGVSGRGRPVTPIVETSDTGGRAPRGEDFGRSLARIEVSRVETEAPSPLVRLRPFAPFLAQLIATRDALPETRRLRRAEPALAAHTYASAMEGVGLLTPGYFVDVAR
jgi:hypothetical protein